MVPLLSSFSLFKMGTNIKDRDAVIPDPMCVTLSSSQSEWSDILLVLFRLNNIHSGHEPSIHVLTDSPLVSLVTHYIKNGTDTDEIRGLAVFPASYSNFQDPVRTKCRALLVSSLQNGASAYLFKCSITLYSSRGRAV